MTQALLVKLIAMVCFNVSPIPEVKIYCAEDMVNCMVTENGKIGSKEDFKKCQEKIGKTFYRQN